MYQELIEMIDKDCLVIGGYDHFLLKEIFTEFCHRHRIRPNTPNWLYLVDELWCNLDHSIRLDFFSEEEFDSWLKDYFI